MSRKVGMITPLAVAFAIVLFVILAEHFEFYLITIAVPGESELRTRIIECATLWTGTWLAIGLATALQRQRCFERGYTWMVGLIPLLWSILGMGFDFYHIRKGSNTLYWLNIVVIVMPVVMGALMTGMLLFLSHLWRNALGTLPNNLCKQCRYDLTGNISGVCPECGRPANCQTT